ncbi:MAG: hypothetical protein ACREMQ_19845 [Longimicrobiales bacterium]
MKSNQTKLDQQNRRIPVPETTDEIVIDAPRVARVREEDLEPHAGLRYIARLFKVLALLLLVMLIAEVIIGLQQEGTAALGTLLIEATRLIVFAGFLWGAGDMALMLVESNHDLRATRILLGRLGARVDRLVDVQAPDRARTGETPADRPRIGIEPPGKASTGP